MKYLHETSPGIFFLDHRLCPEVRGMFAAMASRMPLGGIQARYIEVVEVVAREMQETDWIADAEVRKTEAEHRADARAVWDANPEMRPMWFIRAEDRLCEYPLHPRVQAFFDQFVRDYGHSSILELTGSPSVYTEGISYLTAYLLFDSPLCSGQEFSTRAVRHKDWPMARECSIIKSQHREVHPLRDESGNVLMLTPGHIETEWEVDPDLKALHNDWMEVFEAEVEAWRQEFQSPCPECNGTGVLCDDPDMTIRGLTKVHPTDGTPVLVAVVLQGGETREVTVRACLKCGNTGKKYPTADKEPFRPALDRARWAIPGTIATGCAHTGHLRERARALRDGLNVATKSGCEAAVQTWKDIYDGYRQALPGMAGLGLREAVYDGTEEDIPGHLDLLLTTVPPSDQEVEVKLWPTCRDEDIDNVFPYKRETGKKSYIDPVFNALFQVEVTFRCSLAVLRDWHRHRTMYPWRVAVIGEGPDKNIRLHPAYKPVSDLGKEKLPGLLARSTEMFHKAAAAGNWYKAMMCLPFGTQVEARGTGGLRDVVYLAELRSTVKGANFEYKAQATEALKQLTGLLDAWGKETGIIVREWLGL